MRDTPLGHSNIGRKWFDKDWKKRQRLTQIELRKKAMIRKAKQAAENVKKSSSQIQQKPSKRYQRADSQGMQTIQRYDREDQRKKRKDQGVSEEGDIRDGDFLFQYARFNLGEQALNRLVSVHVREAMWQLYDADSVCLSPPLSYTFSFISRLPLSTHLSSLTYIIHHCTYQLPIYSTYHLSRYIFIPTLLNRITFSHYHASHPSLVKRGGERGREKGKENKSSQLLQDFWTPARLGTKFGFSLELTLGVSFISLPFSFQIFFLFYFYIL